MRKGVKGCNSIVIYSCSLFSAEYFGSTYYFKLFGYYLISAVAVEKSVGILLCLKVVGKGPHTPEDVHVSVAYSRSSKVDIAADTPTVYHYMIAEEKGDFTLADVWRGLIDKMIRRHAHVFGGEKAATADDVAKLWQKIKAAEAGHRMEKQSLMDE